MLRKSSQLKITEQVRQRMQYNFRKGCYSTCKTVKSSQNSATPCGDLNNSDSECIIINDDAAMSTTRAIPSCGLSDSDLLFTQGNGDISPDSDFNVISHSNSQCNSNANSISNSNSNEMNLLNLNCNASSVNL